ncbi:MAG: hypothetical protein GQ574_12240 [Crocinitomix sp.]|nr:hypothetical protein [Crocinitomix sp.]
MNKAILIALLIYSSINYAQGKNSGPKDSTFFINWNLGINGGSNNSSTETNYGINLLESTLGVGPYLGIGFEYRMKNNLGFHADAALMFATRYKKRFITEFDSYYSNYDVIYEQNTLKDKDYITGTANGNMKIGLSYLFRYKGVGMYPQLIAGWITSFAQRYNYTIRESETNYYTNFGLTSKTDWSPYFGAGFTVLFSEYDLAAITTEIGYANRVNNYTIRQSGFGQASSIEEISTTTPNLYWKIGLLLRMDFALIK